LSYVPWKGTTLSRKTQLETSVEYIPREFVKKLNIDRPDEGSQSRLFINSDSSLEDDDM
tara:strand:- start:967 stop:1143 length:177 start_codon:yes stop_codon:yes gene_type:complete